MRGAEWTFHAGTALSTVCDQLHVGTLQGYGVADDSVSVKVEGGGTPALVTRLFGEFIEADEGPVFRRKRSFRAPSKSK